MSLPRITHPSTRGRRLQGRERPFRQTLIALDRRDPRAVVLVTGAAGAGRTAFLDAVCEQLEPSRRVVVVRGRADLGEVPLGAVAPLLAGLPSGPDDGGALVAFHRELNRRDVLLVVDDADLLDSASVCLIEQLVQAGEAAVLLAPSGTRRADDAGSGASRLGAYATLVVELAALPAAEAHALVKDRLGPSVGAPAVDEMIRLSAGSVRTLSELADAAVGADDLCDAAGAWRERWPYITPEVIDSLPANPLTSEPLVEDLVTVLAVAGELPVEQAGTSGVSERSTALAETAGFVTTRQHDGRLWVALAHPLYAAVMLDGLSELARSGFCAAGADMLDGYPEHRVRRTLLQLGAGQRVAPAVLLGLARGELSATRYSTAIALGEYAATGGGCDAELRAAGEFVQAQALSQVGRIDEATEHFAASWRALEQGTVDEEFLARLAQGEGNHLAFRTMRPDLAVARLEPVLERLSDPALVARLGSELDRWRLMAGSASAGGLGSLEVLGSVDTAGDLNLLILTAALHTQGGDLALAAAAAERGLAECERFRDELPNARDLLQLSQVLAFSFTGRFAEARRAARHHLSVAETTNPSARGVWRFVLALVELHTGSPARAWNFISEGRRDLVWRDVAGLLPAADALSAAVAARTGRFAIARSWLDQVTPAEMRDPRVELYSALARAWVSASSGRPGYAIRSLAPALQRAADGGHRYLAALVAYEGVRIEPLVGAGVLLPHIAAVRHAFPLCDAHARVLVARGDVLPVAKQLAEAGLLGPAIDAARWAADSAAGDLVRASRANRLADSWTVRAGISISPPRRTLHPRITPLTDREWQLASGAAALRTSAELAAEYGISVRTVDNHLARIYKKLGITGRRELAAELGQLQLDSSYESR
ncbi:MAG: LuxR family transcriptional regulator [Herbiconiux sp.]|nr:LuxR family transcriptional regulator [Herbiconiux sp.]